MSKSVVLTEQISLTTGTITGRNTFTDASQTSVEETILIGASAFVVNVAIDYSEITVLFIMADQDLTVVTYNGVTEGTTLAIKAGKPLVWYTGSYYSCPISADVTCVKVTNNSGVQATLQIEVLQDPTP